MKKIASAHETALTLSKISIDHAHFGKSWCGLTLSFSIIIIMFIHILLSFVKVVVVELSCKRNLRSMR